MPNCEKCQAVLDYIYKAQANPPPMSFEVEQPMRKAFEDIKGIITKKSPLEQAYEQAKHAGNITKLLRKRREVL